MSECEKDEVVIVRCWVVFNILSLSAPSLKGWEVCLWPPLLPSSRDTSLSITTVLPERAFPDAALRDHPPGGSGGNLLCPRSLHLLQGWGGKHTHKHTHTHTHTHTHLHHMYDSLHLLWRTNSLKSYFSGSCFAWLKLLTGWMCVIIDKK